MVTAFAPVNIALIKYMGKTNGKPTNASLSMTLDQLGTTTSIQKISNSVGIEFEWALDGYVPPMSGRKKAEDFLKHEARWKSAFLACDLPAPNMTGRYQIKTQNNVPAGTGIATSASGFAALTLAWFGVLNENAVQYWKERYESSTRIKRIIADLAALGSGSACRSFEGPWVEWHPSNGTEGLEMEALDLTDFILLFETEAKAVSSSEAHQRVSSSPLFEGRVKRADDRLSLVKEALSAGRILELKKLVLEEALDMHELFHTSVPSFTYLNAESTKWIKMIQLGFSELPSQNAILTLDAGANCHLLVPTREEDLWEIYLTTKIEPFRFVKSRSGKGARYVD